MRFIHWSKHKPSEKIVDLLQLTIEKAKAPTLAEALEEYSQSDKIEYPKIVTTAVGRILKILDGKRKIDALTTKDAVTLFDATVKAFDKSAAYRARATVTNAIRFVVTGEIDPPPNRSTGPTTGGASEPDVAAMKFQAIKTKDALPLFPMFTTAGRFGAIKAGVQKMIYTLAPDDSGYLVPPKRSMTAKEARAIEQTIALMLRRSKLPWIMRWNPDDNVFVLVREKDVQALFPTREKETKKGGGK